LGQEDVQGRSAISAVHARSAHWAATTFAAASRRAAPMERSLTVIDDCSGNDAHGVTRPMNAPTKVQIVAEQRQCRVETTQSVPDITADQHAGGPHGQSVRAIVMLALIVFAAL
jgi:hypothetical protein